MDRKSSEDRVIAHSGNTTCAVKGCAHNAEVGGFCTIHSHMHAFSNGAFNIKTKEERTSCVTNNVNSVVTFKVEAEAATVISLWRRSLRNKFGKEFELLVEDIDILIYVNEMREVLNRIA